MTYPETIDYLCNVIGHRLTGSASLKRANEWMAERMKSWKRSRGATI